MGKIEIGVTAKRTDIENQFSGEIFANNKEGKQITIKYICKNPQLYKKELDIKLIDGDKEIYINGSIYRNDLFKKVNEKQKFLILFSLDIILIMIERMVNFNIEETQSNKKDLAINEVGLKLIFGE